MCFIYLCNGAGVKMPHQRKAKLGNEEPSVTILTPRDAANPESIVSKHYGLSNKKQLMIPRSIIHDHPDGGNRTCEYQQALKKFMPPHFNVNQEGGHYHLLLSVADNQLIFLVNWLALAFELGYLPSHRILLHFSCGGPLTKDFVEKHLLSTCSKDPIRNRSNTDSLWRHTIKDRLATFLDMVDKLDATDWGAMTFDVDAPWIRNMISVFDHYSHGEGSDDKEHHNFDFISQGIMIDRKDPKHDGKVLVNFGGILVKNSPAGKALAKQTRFALDDPNYAHFDWPDQDYVTHALLDASHATQMPLPTLSHLTKDSTYYNEHCHEHPDTCALSSTGVYGNFTVPIPVSELGIGSTQTGVQGTYMFLPGIIAPDKCEHICSESTVLFQHCGLSACLGDKSSSISSSNSSTNENGGGSDPNTFHCPDIPEFILQTHELLKILAFDAIKPSFKPAPHGTFDSQTLQHQTKAVKKFVSTKKLLHFCKVYASVCRMNKRGDGIVPVR